MYEITAEGQTYLAHLLTERLADLIPMQPPIYPAVLYSNRLEPEALADAISERIGMLSGVVKMLEDTLARYEGGFGEPLRQLLKHAVLMNRTEISWCHEFRESVRNGRFYDPSPDSSEEAL